MIYIRSWNIYDLSSHLLLHDLLKLERSVVQVFIHIDQNNL